MYWACQLSSKAVEEMWANLSHLIWPSYNQTTLWSSFKAGRDAGWCFFGGEVGGGGEDTDGEDGHGQRAAARGFRLKPSALKKKKTQTGEKKIKDKRSISVRVQPSYTDLTVMHNAANAIWLMWVSPHPKRS